MLRTGARHELYECTPTVECSTKHMARRSAPCPVGCAEYRALQARWGSGVRTNLDAMPGINAVVENHPDRANDDALVSGWWLEPVRRQDHRSFSCSEFDHRSAN